MEIRALVELGGAEGEDAASRHNFFKDFSSLREVYGTIKIGSEDRGRQTGKIEIDNSNLTAFFVPIHGGYIENADGTEEKCTFDNTNNNNARVKFFIGFSYDGLRANQPIPENAVRANPSKKQIEGKLITIQTKTNYLKCKIIDVNKFHKKLYGKLEGSDKLFDIPFEQSKTYDDYKYYRGQIVNVSQDENGYKIES